MATRETHLKIIETSYLGDKILESLGVLLETIEISSKSAWTPLAANRCGGKCKIKILFVCT